MILNFINRQIRQVKENGIKEVFRKFIVLSRLILSIPFYLFGLFFGFLIIIFSLIIRKKIIVKQIVCWRLGHFLGNTDFFLNIQKKYKFDKYLFLWFYPCPSCNSVLESKINEKINVIPKFIGLPLNHLTNIFFSKIIDSDRDLFNLLDTTEPNLSFTSKEESEGLAFLKSLGIKANDKFVCLNVRDNAYLDFQSTNAGARVDWSYHDYRNCDIRNYKKAAITLANLGYYVFRMGVKVNESFDVDHPKIFDYATNNMRSEFLDVYLGAKCSFAISNGTGFDAIPYVFRRFILYVDHVPLSIINTFSKRFLLTTKKIWSKKLKRFLTFEEIIENNMHKNDFFLNKDNLNKIKLVESTAEEINKYVIEMHERMNGIREESKEDKERQKLFWQIFEKDPMFHGDINASFSTMFLRENSFMLDISKSVSVKKYFPPIKLQITTNNILLRIFGFNVNNFKKKLQSFFSIIFGRDKFLIFNLLLKFFYNIFVILFIPITIPFVILIRLLSPFYRINIGLIISERLGHFAGNTDMYLTNKINKKINVRSFDIFALNYPVSNNFLLRLIRRKIFLLPPIIGKSFYMCNKLLPFKEINQIQSNLYSDRDLFNLLDTTEPNLSFTSKEESEGLAFLKSLGIKANDKFVCLNVRDNAYLTQALPWWDWSYHDYRNCDIRNYKKAAITLANLGYYVFRMGVKVNESFDVDHPKIFDYATNNMRSEFLDVYLGAKCSFAISNGTGFDAIPYVFRRFILYVDHVPLSIINTFSKRFLLTTKKIWSKKLKRFLTFEESFKCGISNDFSGDYKKFDGDLKLVESTAEEINKYVIEMHERMNGIREESKEDKERQKLFWQIFEKNPALHGDINAHFSSVFLKENKALLE